MTKSSTVDRLTVNYIVLALSPQASWHLSGNLGSFACCAVYVRSHGRKGCRWERQRLHHTRKANALLSKNRRQC